MGSSLGNLRRNTTTSPGKANEENDSDQENKDVKDETLELNPDATIWQTPEMVPGNLKSQHILSLIDPRSPNQSIARTPIIVTNFD